MNKPLLSIVIPAKDEQSNIGPLIREIDQSLRGVHSFEILVVDDGSSDDTFNEVLRTAEALECSARAIRHQSSTGQSTALLTAVRQAHGHFIVTLDGDGQNDPADIPRMVERAMSLEQERFCIAGYRKKRKDTAWKRFQSRLANRFRNAVLKDGVPDTGCGLKLIPRATYLSLPYFDHMHRFLPALVKSQGGGIDVMEVNHRDRMQGTSKYTATNRLWVGLIDMLGVIWLQLRTKNPVIEEVRENRPLP